MYLKSGIELGPGLRRGTKPAELCASDGCVQGGEFHPSTSFSSNRHPIRSSFAMIRMVRKDRSGTPQLLGEHRPGEEMGPGRLAEGEEKVGTGAVGLAESV